MNITELARRLRTTTQELRDALPKLGFDIGQKAIKVDDRTAHKIMNQWSAYRKRIEEKQRREAAEKEKEKVREQFMNKEIRIPAFITVRDFAKVLGMSVNQVITELMKNGVLASLNERIDFDTAAIIGQELGVSIIKDEAYEEDTEEVNKITESLKGEDVSHLSSRPPVVVVMGHVDHGKTKLLDAIRHTDIVSQESGGITQHIGAYQVSKNGKKISFIDTPGHEAFTAMRSRGARIADIAILVVAADDSIKPQTLEAIKIIEKTKLPMIVAINKIDKPEANVERVKQDLAKLNLVPEDWGGKTITVPISAKEGTNIDALLDIILLVTEVEKDRIVANPNRHAIGTVIESHIDKGEGAVATVLIQAGTLREGEVLCIDQTVYGKVRAMKDWRGDAVQEASSSTPVKLIGFKVAPAVGDVVEVCSEAGHFTKVSKKKAKATGVVITSQKTMKPKDENETSVTKQSLDVMLKADVLGSAEAIAESLEKIEHEDVFITITSKRLGNITESDVLKAEAEGAHILGFNISIAPSTQTLAKEKNVDVRVFRVIYELIDYVKDELRKLIQVQIVDESIGKLEVLAIFKTEPKSMIVGGKVLSGRVEPSTKAKVYRNSDFVVEGRITQLQSGKQEVSDVLVGQEAGLRFEGLPLIQVGDSLEVFKEQRVEKKLV